MNIYDLSRTEASATKSKPQQPYNGLSDLIMALKTLYLYTALILAILASLARSQKFQRARQKNSGPDIITVLINFLATQFFI